MKCNSLFPTPCFPDGEGKEETIEPALGVGVTETKGRCGDSFLAGSGDPPADWGRGRPWVTAASSSHSDQGKV